MWFIFTSHWWKLTFKCSTAVYFNERVWVWALWILIFKLVESRKKDSHKNTHLFEQGYSSCRGQRDVDTGSVCAWGWWGVLVHKRSLKWARKGFWPTESKQDERRVRGWGPCEGVPMDQSRGESCSYTSSPKSHIQKAFWTHSCTSSAPFDHATRLVSSKTTSKNRTETHIFI